MKQIYVRLIRSILRSDIFSARKIVRELCETNTVKADESFCESMLNELKKSEINLLELPANLKDYVVVEDIKSVFNPQTYVATDETNEIIEFSKRYYNNRDRLLSMGIHYSNTLMLYGDTGCGKTELCRMLASELGLPLVRVNFTMLRNSLMGSTSKNLSNVFRVANEQPCVFLLDEFDALCGSRIAGDSEVSREQVSICISFMQELDMLSKDAFVVAATNLETNIDSAIVNRFALKFRVPNPTLEMQCSVLESYINSLKGVSVSLDNIVAFVYSKCYNNFRDLKNEATRKIIDCVVEDRDVVL